MRDAFKSVLVFLVAAAAGTGIAFAGSSHGMMVFNKLPLFALCVITAFAINWLAFIPAYIFQTERFFDLAGSITYITVTLAALLLSPVHNVRTYIITVIVLIWSVRLGSFLFKRIMKEGRDSRFDNLKPHFLRYLSVWTLQGLWVTLTLSAALVAITTPAKSSFDAFTVAGTIIWTTGFTIEAVADAQKSKWRSTPANKGRFINKGLWSRSRHPNYFGEIVIWIGVAVIALPVMQGWQYLTLISPLFVTILITRISGLPLLEKSADKKWGGSDDYEEYKKNTPVLIPKLKI